MAVEIANSRFAAWPFAAIILLVLLVILWRRKHSLSYLFCLAVFSLYLLFALDKAFFPLLISGDSIDGMRQTPVQLTSFINLIPFNFNFSFIPDMVLLQIVQNVLLTIPFGFGVGFLAPLRPRRVFWLGLAVGFAIELTQLVTNLLLRTFYRVIDVNDLLMNALGVWLGYAIFRGFAWLYLWATRRFGFRLGGLAVYIHQVASRA